MEVKAQKEYLKRIDTALRIAGGIARDYAPGTFQVNDQGGRNVVTEVDRRVSEVLRIELLRDGEGWLSEEDVDDESRLSRDFVWIVDPLDGTREFVDGLPEWCISIGLVENGQPVAGGTFNPAANEIVLGAIGTGVTYNNQPARPTTRAELDGAVVLASRSEWKRGEWSQFETAPFTVKPLGSVAYKLSLVAGGIADATWTLSPKHEWDVAAGIALIRSAGGRVETTDGAPLRLNQKKTLLPGLIASGDALWPAIESLLCTK